MTVAPISAVSNVSGSLLPPQTQNTAVNTKTESVFLDDTLKEIKAKQGFLGKASNSIKKFFNVGVSSKDCEKAIEQYKQGEISYDDVVKKLTDYKNSQDSNVNLISNIVTGIASIAVATIGVKAGHINWATAFKLGAPTGAAVKTGLKIADRASNNVNGDELDTKEITKDLISGAVTGTTSAVSSNIGIGIKKGDWMLSVKNGTECGLLCGALSGSTNYLTDTALDKDKKFNINNLIETTATSAFVSGTVGGVVGAGVYGLTSPTSAAASSGVTETIIKDSASSSSRKLLGSVERSMMQTPAA